ncbi:hypothetical protein BKA83DRAFT_4127109 [Pisolithus microcarpus]|nr:hypothetical protein BKA83DRAFT_4127109 [Pisolithus microcarpus]
MVTPTFVITRLTTLRCGKAHDERDSGGAYSQLDRDYGLQPRESMQIFSLARMVASCSHSIDDRSQSHSEPLGIRMNHQHLLNGVHNNVTKMPARSLEVVACSTRRNEPLSFLLHPLSMCCLTASVEWRKGIMQLFTSRAGGLFEREWSCRLQLIIVAQFESTKRHHGLWILHCTPSSSLDPNLRE